MMGGIVYCMGYVPLHGELTRLIVQIATGIVVYVVFCQVLRLSPYIEMTAMLMERLTTVSGSSKSRA